MHTLNGYILLIARYANIRVMTATASYAIRSSCSGWFPDTFNETPATGVPADTRHSVKIHGGGTGYAGPSKKSLSLSDA